jgi:hypothetical protein
MEEPFFVETAQEPAETEKFVSKPLNVPKIDSVPPLQQRNSAFTREPEEPFIKKAPIPDPVMKPAASNVQSGGFFGSGVSR